MYAWGVRYKYNVVDVSALAVSSPSGNITWTEGQDHAKWGVALDDSHVRSQNI